MPKSVGTVMDCRKKNTKIIDRKRNKILVKVSLKNFKFFKQSMEKKREFLQTITKKKLPNKSQVKSKNFVKELPKKQTISVEKVSLICSNFSENLIYLFLTQNDSCSHTLSLHMILKIFLRYVIFLLWKYSYIFISKIDRFIHILFLYKIVC